MKHIISYIILHIIMLFMASPVAWFIVLKFFIYIVRIVYLEFEDDDDHNNNKNSSISSKFAIFYEQDDVQLRWPLRLQPSLWINFLKAVSFLKSLGRMCSTNIAINHLLAVFSITYSWWFLNCDAIYLARQKSKPLKNLTNFTRTIERYMTQNFTH